MIVNRVKMHNFKCYTPEAEVNVTTGINVIIGENGAGKSSILEAINFGLFKEKGAKADTLISLGKKGMGVLIDFRIGHNDYMVIRKKSARKAADELYIKEDGHNELIASGDVEVSKYIEDLLGLSKDVFISAVYIKQGEIDGILDMDPSKRKKLVSNILGIERFEKAWTQMGPSGRLIGLFENRKSVLEGEISQKDELELEKIVNASEINGFTQELSVSIDKFEKEKKNRDDISNEKQNMDGLKIKYVKLDGDFNSKNAMREMNKINLDRAEKQITKISHAEEENKTFEPEIKKLVSLNSLKGTYTNLSIKNVERDSIENEFKKVDEWKNTIATCKSSFDEYVLCDRDYRALNKNKKKAGDMEKKIDVLKKEIDNIHEWMNTLIELKDDHDKYAGIDNNLKLISDKKTEISGLISDIDKMNASLSNISKYRNHMETAKEGHDQYLHLEERKKALDANLEGYKGSDVGYRQLEKYIKNINNKIKKVQKEIKSLVIEYCDILEVDVCEPHLISDLKAKTQLSYVDEFKIIEDKFLETGSEIDRLKGEQKTKKDALKKLESDSGDQCPTCGTDLSDNKKETIISEYKRKINEIERDIKVLQKEKSAFEKRKFELSDLIQSLNDINIKLLNKNLGELKEHRADVENKNKELEDLKPKMDALVKIDGEIKSIKDAQKKFETPYKEYIGSEMALKDLLSSKNERSINEDLVSFREKLTGVVGEINQIQYLNGPVEISEDKKSLFKNIDKETMHLKHILSDIKSLYDKYNLAESNLSGKSEEKISSELEQKRIELSGFIDTINESITEGSKIIMESEEDSIINLIDTRIEILIGKMDSLQKHHDSYKTASENLLKVDENKLIENRNNVKEIIAGIEESIARLIDNLGFTPSDVEEEIIRITKISQNYEQNIGIINTRDETVKEKEIASNNIESISEEIRKILEAIKELNYDEKLHLECIDKLNTANEELKKAGEENVKLEERIKAAEKRQEEISGQLIKIKGKENELKKLRAYILLLKDIRQTIDKDNLQNEIRKRSIPIISKYANEFFSSFNLKYSSMMITEDYSIKLCGPGGEYKVNMISGGERIAAALALRVGIAKAMSGGSMELLILDEPTVHLDDIRRHELVDIVKKFINIPQTIVVTHDEEFDQAANTIIKVKSDDGVPKIENN